MTAKQDKAALLEKLADQDYTDFVELKPGLEGIQMLYVHGLHVCSVQYALEMPVDKLHALIKETLEVA